MYMLNPSPTTTMMMMIIKDIKLRKEHQVTVESKQNNPLGAEMEVIDGSIAGEGVKIEKSSNRKNKRKDVDINVE